MGVRIIAISVSVCLSVCPQAYLNNRLSYRRETRGSARRSVSVEILAYCDTNNANRLRVSLMSTFSNCNVLLRYLHSFVHASLH